VVKIRNYSIYHCNHPDGTDNGGTAIIIRTTLQHYEVPAYQTEKIQAAIIQIKARPWSFNIAAMYSPPRHRMFPKMRAKLITLPKFPLAKFYLVFMTSILQFLFLM